MKQFLVLMVCLIYFVNLSAQSLVQRVEPPNWWVGMKNPNLQLLIYGNDLQGLKPSINYPGIRIKRTISVDSPNYLFIDLVIDPSTQPGMVNIEFLEGKTIVATVQYPINKREQSGEELIGFDQSDVLYLITPDRFANGSTENDEVAGLLEKPNRGLKGGRHGGDIQGITDHLDYIADLGFTAIWLNPLLENDMEEYSYHGYSTTDFYQVDPRFGSNEEYKQLAKIAQQKGIKLIMDMIVNHCGSFHWWMDDLPTEDWLNQWPAYKGTNHRKSVLQDPHVAEIDRKIFTDGWFVPTMPDLNQRNESMGIYLIQNSIWWIEYLGLAGIRMDTYPYPDMDYMALWTKRVMEEYPNFNVVGEEWYGNPTIVAYWQKGKINPNGYSSYLKSLMDFPVQQAMANALVADETFSSGWIELYEMIAQDFVYANPFDLVVFPDNHDMSRIFSQVNEDIGLFKLALAFTLTTRGIPQIYYGTEILMKNPGTTDHGIIRSDFPGGWDQDPRNGFTNEGLSTEQIEAKEFLRTLLRWRKENPVVQYGKLKHFIPEEGVYVYFRYLDGKTVMVILNKNQSNTLLSLDRFSEVLKGTSKGLDVITNQEISLDKHINVPGRSPLILALK